jgi:hypothetical protein
MPPRPFPLRPRVLLLCRSPSHPSGGSAGVGAISIPRKPSSVEILLTVKLSLSPGALSSSFPSRETVVRQIFRRGERRREETLIWVPTRLQLKMGPWFAYSVGP